MAEEEFSMNEVSFPLYRDCKIKEKDGKQTFFSYLGGKSSTRNKILPGERACLRLCLCTKGPAKTIWTSEEFTVLAVAEPPKKTKYHLRKLKENCAWETISEGIYVMKWYVSPEKQPDGTVFAVRTELPIDGLGKIAKDWFTMRNLTLENRKRKRDCELLERRIEQTLKSKRHYLTEREKLDKKLTIIDTKLKTDRKKSAEYLELIDQAKKKIEAVDANYTGE